MAEGEAELHLQTSLEALHPDHTVLEGPDGTFERPADLVFEMIGAELPLGLFERVGIRLRSQWTWARRLSMAGLLVAVYMLYPVKNSVPVFPCSPSPSTPRARRAACGRGCTATAARAPPSRQGRPLLAEGVLHRLGAVPDLRGDPALRSCTPTTRTRCGRPAPRSSTSGSWRCCPSGSTRSVDVLSFERKGEKIPPTIP